MSAFWSQLRASLAPALEAAARAPLLGQARAALFAMGGWEPAAEGLARGLLVDGGPEAAEAGVILGFAPGADVDVLEPFTAKGGRQIPRGAQGRCEEGPEEDGGFWVSFPAVELVGTNAASVQPWNLAKMAVVWRDWPLVAAGEAVPAWAYSQAALNHLGPWWAGTAVACAAGPAALWGRKAAKATLATYLALPVLAWAMTPCGNDLRGFAQVPGLFYVPAGLALLYLLHLEVKVRQYTLIHQVLRAKKKDGFKLFGTAVPFCNWLAVYTAVSAAAHADIITSAIFVAKALATDACNPSMTAMWRETMRQSAVSRLVGVPSWGAVVTVAWALMLFQAVYGALLLVPQRVRLWESKRPAEAMKYELVPKRDRAHLLTEYESLAGTWLLNSHVVDVCADLGRMSTVTALATDILRASFVADGAGTVEKMPGLLMHAFRKCLAFPVLESAVALNVQSAGLALGKALSPEHALDRQVLLSLAFGFAMATKNIYEQVTAVLALRAMIRQYGVREFVAEKERRGARGLPATSCFEELLAWLEGEDGRAYLRENPHFAAGEAQLRGLIRAKSVLWHCMPAFVALWALCLGLVARAACQTAMAAACPGGLHNVGRGCVKLPG